MCCFIVKAAASAKLATVLTLLILTNRQGSTYVVRAIIRAIRTIEASLTTMLTFYHI